MLDVLCTHKIGGHSIIQVRSFISSVDRICLFTNSKKKLNSKFFKTEKCSNLKLFNFRNVQI
jgi:hypothetical protein